MVSFSTIYIISISFHILFYIFRALVPPSETFTYVNEGEFGIYVVEYDATYRTLSVFRNPFQLCFYNTTPNAYTLALRMGTPQSESLMRWVWEANRGKPVRENATFSLGTDGNLVLAYNSPRPMLYWAEYPWTFNDTSVFTNLTLISEPRYPDDLSLWFVYFLLNVTNYDPLIARTLSGRAFSRYNNTLTYLRLRIDGNLRYFTYTIDMQNTAWDPVYTLLDRDSDETECQLPERCGKFGLCEDNQCVACPTPNGLLGWSKDCKAKKVTSCKANDFYYYKLEGVDHFMIKYTRGDMTKQSDCKSKCTRDCKCMGYFYHTDKSRCWIAYDLKTLTRVGNLTNLAYIKTPNK